MNMRLWVAANETTAETNIYKYEVEKDARRSKDHRSREEETHTGCKDGTAPAPMPQFQKV